MIKLYRYIHTSVLYMKEKILRKTLKKLKEDV